MRKGAFADAGPPARLVAVARVAVAAADHGEVPAARAVQVPEVDEHAAGRRVRDAAHGRARCTPVSLPKRPHRLASRGLTGKAGLATDAVATLAAVVLAVPVGLAVLLGGAVQGFRLPGAVAGLGAGRRATLGGAGGEDVPLSVQEDVVAGHARGPRTARCCWALKRCRLKLVSYHALPNYGVIVDRRRAGIHHAAKRPLWKLHAYVFAWKGELEQYGGYLGLS